MYSTAFGPGRYLAPQLALRAEDVRRELGLEPGGHRVVAVHLLERQVAANRQRLAVAVLRLVVVEVGVRVRRHHDVVAGARRGDPALLAAPRHHDRVRRQSALEDFVPADEPPAVLRQERVHLLHEPALQLPPRPSARAP